MSQGLRICVSLINWFSGLWFICTFWDLWGLECWWGFFIDVVEFWETGRFHSFEIAHMMDRNSTGRGVRQFKTSLLQRLEQVYIMNLCFWLLFPSSENKRCHLLLFATLSMLNFECLAYDGMDPYFFWLGWSCYYFKKEGEKWFAWTKACFPRIQGSY